MNRLAPVLAIVLAAPALVAQQKPDDTFILRGRVVAADESALMLRGARMTRWR